MRKQARGAYCRRGRKAARSLAARVWQKGASQACRPALLGRPLAALPACSQAAAVSATNTSARWYPRPAAMLVAEPWGVGLGDIHEDYCGEEGW